MIGFYAAGAMGAGPPPSASYDDSVMADSPVAYWKCDETTGTNVADSSGNGHNLTAVFFAANTMATVSVPAASGFAGLGRALDLNLANTTLVRNVSPSTTLRMLGTAVTFEFLFRRQAASGYQWIISNLDNNGSSINYFELRLNRTTDTFQLLSAGGSAGFQIATGITDGNPHLIHLVLNSARTSVAYYRDGSFVNNIAISGGTWSTGSGNSQLWIGRRMDGNSPSFFCNNIALYASALDSTRVAERWARRDSP